MDPSNKSTDEGTEPRRRSGRRRSRILVATAVLPALFTLGNGMCGFASICLATMAAPGEHLGQLWNAGLLLFAAMVCDMLDGRLARMTRRTSDFGAQLDSLCDMISFGVAPAILMIRTVSVALNGQIPRISEFLVDFPLMERVIWGAAAIYVACAAVRLARFNVENEPDESAHMSFKGLPSPGAAAAVAALVLLFVRLYSIQKGWRASPEMLVAVVWVLPIVTLLAALLMVSRFRYPHVVNQFIRGKRPVNYLVKFLIVALAVWLEPFVTGAVVTVAYAFSGPVAWAYRKVRHRPATPPPPAR
jgi:CDP-diacylglycerol--serine O-phosphatidyltransferase